MDAKNGTITLTFTGDIKDLTNKMNSIQKNMGNLSQETSSFGEKIVSGFSKAASSLKRITLSMVGIYSTYRMLSKASSAYLAQDQETSRKIQAAWIGLGAMFAPLLEKIGTFVITAVKYLNVFIKALFGIDLIARANAKSFGKAAKAANAYKGALMGIDEITNVEIQTGGAGGLGADDFNWLDEFNKIDLNPTIVKWLEKLAGFIKENWRELALGLGLVATAILGFKALHAVFSFIDKMLQMQTISKSLAKAVGTAGLATAITTVAGVLATLAGVFTLVNSAIEFFQKGAIHSLYEMVAGVGLLVGAVGVVTGNIGLAVAGLGVAIVGGLAAWATYTEAYVKNEDAADKLVATKKRLKEIEDKLKGVTADYTQAIDRERDAMKRLAEVQGETRLSGEELYNQVKDNTEIYSTFNDKQRKTYNAYRDLVEATEEVSKATEDLSEVKKDHIKLSEEEEKQKQKLIDIGRDGRVQMELDAGMYPVYRDTVVDAYKDMELSAGEAADLIAKAMKGMSDATKEQFTDKLPTQIKKALEARQYQDQMNKLESSFAIMGSRIANGTLSKLSLSIGNFLSGGKGYALGLQEVPHDMVTTVHKGEAIVPAKFNKDSYFNGQPQYASDNSDVVAAVQYLTDVLIRKDMSVNIDRKDIGNIAIEHINSETRRLGMGVI